MAARSDAVDDASHRPSETGVPVPSIVHASSGLTIPGLGLGTWRTDNAVLYDAIRSAIRCGYRHIDCAPIYGNQHIIGAAIADAISAGEVTRKELFIVSKLASTECEPPYVMPALEKTLADLRIDYLDLYLIHWPFRYIHAPSQWPVPEEERLGYSPAAVLETWRVLEDAHARGAVHALGVSNFTVRKLEHLLSADLRVKLVCNQVELHPYLAQPELVAWCQAHDILVTGYCPLGSPARPPNFRSEADPPELLHHPAVLDLAAKYTRSAAQILLRWAIQRGTIPLPKSVTPARLEENLRCFDYELSDDDMRRIDALNSGWRYCKAENMRRKGETLSDVWDETPSSAP